MISEKRALRRAVLNESGVERVKRRHPWLFRGNLIQVPQCAPGDLVAFCDRGGAVLGHGLWSESTLCLRVLTFGSREPDQMALFRRRIESALALRKRWCAGEESYRWVHGEADLLPGVTADLYGDVLSLQLTSFGWYRHADEVAKIFRKVKKLSAIILRNDTKHLDKEGIPREVKALLGETPSSPIKVRIGENLEFVDISSGQKTGTYLDVRHIPAQLEPLFGGARVLDCFSYQGNFTLQALKCGASYVEMIDQSQTALDRARDNILLNGLRPDSVKFRCGNAFDILREIDGERGRFDLVIMDPPPFAPSKGQLDSARRGYKELAVRGFRRLETGGHLLFLSCSHPFGRELLLETLEDAARDAGTACRVVREIKQPEDHPRLLGVPETEYLKGFLMEVIDR
ncbi:MAG: class I SAM-dependent rRNA methyltransferase [Synergistes sp.]|nr:class I SAM-dependent rRNA methyltransferase [Synergistes sp.]